MLNFLIKSSYMYFDKWIINGGVLFSNEKGIKFIYLIVRIDFNVFCWVKEIRFDGFCDVWFFL